MIRAEESEETREKVSPSPILLKLLEARKVLMSGEVDSDLSHKIVAQLLYLDSVDPEAPIDLVINSPGGEVTSGLAIYDTIRSIQAPVNCICSGLTASIATIVLIAAEKGRRKAQPNARILIHQPLGGIRGQATDIDIHAREILKTREHINGMLAEATGQTQEKINEDTNRDYWMSSQEALDYGLVDEILEYRR